MHLNGALTVSNVVQFLTGDLVHILENCWKVVIGHVLEGEFPELFAFVWVKFSMVSRMFIPSTVAHPYVVSFVGQQKSRSFVLVVNQPSIRAIKQSMLEQDGLGTAFDDAIFSLDSEQSQNVTIFCGNEVLFNGVVVELAVIHEF